MPLHPRRALRAAILAQWTLIGLSLLADLFPHGGIVGIFSAAAEGDGASGSDSSGSFDVPEGIAAFLFLPLLFANLLGSAGLWLLLRWGRPLYAGTTIAFTLSTLLLSASEEYPLAAMLNEFAVMISGAIIALSYYAPLHFRRQAP